MRPGCGRWGKWLYTADHLGELLGTWASGGNCLGWTFARNYVLAVIRYQFHPVSSSVSSCSQYFLICFAPFTPFQSLFCPPLKCHLSGPPFGLCSWSSRLHQGGPYGTFEFTVEVSWFYMETYGSFVGVFKGGITEYGYDIPSGKLTQTLAVIGVGRLVSITNWWFPRSMFIYHRVLCSFMF